MTGVQTCALPISACAYNLAQLTPTQNQPLPAAGGNGTLQVSTAPGCAWSARGEGSFPPWLTLTGATSGVGPGTLQFSVAPNDNDMDNFRLGSVTGYAALPAFTIGQLGRGGQCGARAITAGETVRGTFKPGDCYNSLRFPDGLNSPGSASVRVHSFTFSAARGDQFALQLRPGANVYAGVSALFDPRGRAVSLNNGYPPSPRVTLPLGGVYTLEVAGYSGDYEFVLDLTAGACGFTLESDQAQFSSAGGSGTVNVLTPSDCSWAASSTTPWITLTRNSGRGNGTLSFTVAPNTEGTETRTRLGIIQLAGNSIPIVQAGRDGSCAPLPISAGQTLAGELTARD